MFRWMAFALLLSSACGRRNFNVDGGEDIDAPAGGRANYVFATSSLHTGNLGGLAGADAICQQHATAAGLTGTFVAYLSTAGAHASTRLVGSRGWQRVDGKPFADTPAQLASLRQWYPVATDELGNDLRGLRYEVWTGSQSTGAISSTTCTDWTNGTVGVNGLAGLLESGGSRWTDAPTLMCSETARLYCFELGNTTVSPPPPVTGRLAFISNSVFAPSSVATADSLCTAEGQATGRTGTFRAALPLSNVPTQQRFNLTGPTWVRADGVPIVDAAAAMFTASVARAHVILTADGQVAGQTVYWAGLPDTLASTAENCGDWMTPANGTAYIGRAEATTRGQRFVADGRACNQAAALLCLED